MASVPGSELFLTPLAIMLPGKLGRIFFDAKPPGPGKIRFEVPRRPELPSMKPCITPSGKRGQVSGLLLTHLDENEGGKYRTLAMFSYDPSPAVQKCCKKIAFGQTVRTWEVWGGDGDWRIRRVGYQRLELKLDNLELTGRLNERFSKSPVTGPKWAYKRGQYGIPAINQPAEILDFPGYGGSRPWPLGLAKFGQEFESCAVCVEGTPEIKGRVLACIKWGHYMTKDDGVVLRYIGWKAAWGSRPLSFGRTFKLPSQPPTISYLGTRPSHNVDTSGPGSPTWGFLAMTGLRDSGLGAQPPQGEIDPR